MKKWAELVFDGVYLILILGYGAVVTALGRGNPAAALFGAMALVLGAGDLAHLAPRMRLLWTGRVHPELLGAGKLAASVTSAAYYLLLCYAWQVWLGLYHPVVRGAAWGLVLARVVLCCLPRNRWRVGGAGRRWALVRNLPFLLLGILLVAYFCATGGGRLWQIPLAAGLSFGCYLPVVLWGDRRPALGMLMMPKTLCYLWIQLVGLGAL